MGGSTVSVIVSGSGVGQAIKKSGNSYARTIISASATGLKIISGSNTAVIVVKNTGSGSKIIQNGSTSKVVVSASAGYLVIRQGSSGSKVVVSSSGSGLSIRKGSSNSVVIIRAFGGGTISDAMMLTAVASYIKRDKSVEVICRTRNIRSARVRVNSEAINVTYKQNKATVIERDTKAEVKN